MAWQAKSGIIFITIEADSSCLNWGPSHMMLRARDHCTSSKSHWCKKWSRSKFASHYASRTNWVSWCKMDGWSTWIPTWHQMDHVSWSLGLFSNHLLEVGLTHQVTMALQNLTTIDLLIMCEDPMNRTRCKSICWGRNHMRLHTTLEGMWPHSMILGTVLERPQNTSLGLSQFETTESQKCYELAPH